MLVELSSRFSCSSPWSLASHPWRGPRAGGPCPPASPSLLPPLTPSAQPPVTPSSPFLFSSFPHPSTFGFSNYQPQSDKAKILLNPFSVDNTTTFPVLRLTFLHQRLLVSGVMIPAQVSPFIPVKHFIFPLLSPSVPHRSPRSPHPPHKTEYQRNSLYFRHRENQRRAQCTGKTTEPH